MELRCKMGCAQSWAKSLIGMSVGRQPSVWSQLAEVTSGTRLVLIAGSKDAKFVQVMKRIAAMTASQKCVNVETLVAKQLQQASGITSSCNEGSVGQNGLVTVIVQDCGHAVHIEHPQVLLQLLADV